MRNLEVIGAFAALAVLSVPGCAGQKREKRTEYYDVSGGTASALRNQLNRLGPRNASGERSDGLTDWQVKWVYRLRTNDKDCWLSSFGTYVEMVTTLPNWQPTSSASKDLREQWRAYMSALEAHEAGHAQIAEAAAAEIDRRVRSLNQRQTCDAFKRAIDDVASEALADYRQRDAQYDQETQHGMTQGACFPCVVTYAFAPSVVAEVPRKRILFSSSPVMRPHKILGAVSVELNAPPNSGSTTIARPNSQTNELLQDKAMETYGGGEVDAGLDPDVERRRYTAYQQRFGIKLEPLEIGSVEFQVSSLRKLLSD